MTNVHDLDDASLIASLGRIVHAHRRSTVEMILHLAEMDSRKLHLNQGFSSLFKYCLDVLRFSEDEAARRIDAARLVRDYPAARALLESGLLSLSVACQLRKVITRESADELISGVSGLSARKTAEWLAARFPRPDVPEVIRKVPAAQVELVPAPGPVTSVPAAVERAETTPEPPKAAPSSREQQRPKPKSHVEPLSSDRFSIKLTVSRATRDKLERVRDLARHRCPDGSLEALLDMAIDELLAKLERERHGKVNAPHASRPTRDKASRSLKMRTAITAAARRAVAARSQCRCEYVSSEGKRCDATAFLEIDHIVPVALGGSSDPSNLRHLCRAHNRLAAESALGKEYVQQAIENARRNTIRDVANPVRLYARKPSPATSRVTRDRPVEWSEGAMRIRARAPCDSVTRLYVKGGRRDCEREPSPATSLASSRGWR